jgi:hypothetical protein
VDKTAETQAFLCFCIFLVTVQPCKFCAAQAEESLLSYAYAAQNLYGTLPQRDEAQRNRADG